MSITVPHMNNHATALIITINNNTLTFSSTITTTVISSVSGMVNINPALAISVAATEQDFNFETRLNAMENTIFKLEGTFEKIHFSKYFFGQVTRRK